MNKDVRARCVERSGGNCENGDCGKWAGEALHADHFFGRARIMESLATVWMLCPTCDFMKTTNRPNRSAWLGAYLTHCLKYGYETKRIEALIDWQMTKMGGPKR